MDQLYPKLYLKIPKEKTDSPTTIQTNLVRVITLDKLKFQASTAMFVTHVYALVDSSLN